MINTSIRRALVLSSLVLGATTVVSSKAMAGTTGNVPLSGTVASSLALVTNPTTGVGGAGDLNLTPGQRIVKVADLTISTNNQEGYTLTASAYGDLTKTTGGTASISYQVLATADGTVPVAADFTTATGATYTYGTNAANDVATGERDLSILFTPAALQDPGTYTGSITLNVADN